MKEVIRKTKVSEMDRLEKALFHLRREVHDGGYWVEDLRTHGHCQQIKLRLKKNGNDHFLYVADKGGVTVSEA